MCAQTASSCGSARCDGEVGDLRLERADQIGGGVDDRRAEAGDGVGRAVERRREPRRIGVEPDAQHRARRRPGLVEPVVEAHHSSSVMAPVGQRSAASRTLSWSSARRLLLQHVEEAVAADLEDLRADLHAAAGRGADVVVDDHLHGAVLLTLIGRSRALRRTVAVGLGRRRVAVAPLRPGALVEPPAGHVVDARVGVGLDRMGDAGRRRRPARPTPDPAVLGVAGHAAHRLVVDARALVGRAIRSIRRTAARSPTAATGGSPSSSGGHDAGGPTRGWASRRRLGPAHGDDRARSPHRGSPAA